MWIVRLSWVERHDWIPTREQIVNGLADSHEELRLAWMEKLKIYGRLLLSGEDEEIVNSL